MVAILNFWCQNEYYAFFDMWKCRTEMDCMYTVNCDRNILFCRMQPMGIHSCFVVLFVCHVVETRNVIKKNRFYSGALGGASQKLLTSVAIDTTFQCALACAADDECSSYSYVLHEHVCSTYSQGDVPAIIKPQQKSNTFHKGENYVFKQNSSYVAVD